MKFHIAEVDLPNMKLTLMLGDLSWSWSPASQWHVFILGTPVGPTVPMVTSQEVSFSRMNNTVEVVQHNHLMVV